MKTFEYMKDTWDRTLCENDFIEWLQPYGLFGWELCVIEKIIYDAKNMPIARICVFKKEKGRHPI